VKDRELRVLEYSSPFVGNRHDVMGFQ
jgi:hypothetical protein